MSNFHLAFTATITCLILGVMSCVCVVFMKLTGPAFWLASFMGIACLPLGLFLAYMTYVEREIEANKSSKRGGGN